MRASQAPETLLEYLKDLLNGGSMVIDASARKGKLGNRHYESADLVVVEVDLFFKDVFVLSPSSSLRFFACCFQGLRLGQSCLSASQGLAIYGESQDSFWYTPQGRLRDSARHKIRNFISKMITFEKNSVC